MSGPKTLVENLRCNLYESSLVRLTSGLCAGQSSSSTQTFSLWTALPVHEIYNAAVNTIVCFQFYVWKFGQNQQFWL